MTVQAQTQPIAPAAASKRVHRRQLSDRAILNLFIWPTNESDRSEQTETHQGYNVIHWCQTDMSYWAVSDLNANELREFVGLARSKYSQRTP